MKLTQASLGMDANLGVDLTRSIVVLKCLWNILVGSPDQQDTIEGLLDCLRSSASHMTAYKGPHYTIGHGIQQVPISGRHRLQRILGLHLTRQSANLFRHRAD
jgi:hypothetical protein